MTPTKKQIARAFAVLSILTLLFASTTVLADPGDLDTTFDTDGIVTTAVGSGHDLGNATAIQSDGKILVAGTSSNGTNNDFALVRYNTDGSLDTTFDTDGIVTTDFGDNDNGESMAIQSDGKIVVAGDSNAPGTFDFAVARYNTDGSLDTTFDTDGMATTDFGVLHDRAYAVAIQSDGKIVVAGYARMSPTTPVNNDFALVRYNSDGSLDNTFDTDGMLTTSIGGGQDQAYAIGIQSDGKIVVAGYSNVGANYDFVVVRYNTDGSLDNTFDTDGIVTTAIRDDDDFAYGLAIQSDGKIVVVGYGTIVTAGNHDDFVVVRYNTDGSLDTTFDTDGKVVTDIGLRNDHATAVALQSDDKIVVVGSSENASNYDFAVVDYNSDGSLNTDFGTGGMVTTPILSINDTASSVAIQADGKIVVAGRAQTATANDFAVARYEAAGGNAPPVAVDDSGAGFTTDEDTPFTTGNVLANDTDPNPTDTLSVASYNTDVLSGTLASNGDGTFDYDPDGKFESLRPGDSASDIFTYVVTDGVLTDTATVTITVNGVNDAPTVDAGANQTSDEGDPVSFSGSFTDPDPSPSPPAGDQIAWAFGDGSTITGTLTPSHTFADENVYTVTLTITDTYGGVGEDSLQVTVDNVAPVVDAGPDANLAVGQTFTRMGSFTDPGADTWTATVDYGTGAGPTNLSLVGKSFDLSQVYATAGTYTVTVAVEDDDGGVGTDEVIVTVGALPTADLEIGQSLSIEYADTIFTIAARNNGPDVAPGSIVSVTFPTAFTDVTWSCEAGGGASCPSGGTGTGVGNRIYNTLSDFPNGGVVTYTVHTRVPGDAIYYDAAEVIPPSNVIDPDMSNNHSMQATRFLWIMPLIYHNAHPQP
jgi:uncharacterized delta-60 repeat protein